MASNSEPKRQRNKVDYDNVILALPAVFPPQRRKKKTRAGEENGATTSKNTATGQKDVLLLDGPGEHEMNQQSGFAKKPDNVNNEHPIQEEHTGLPKEPNPVDNELDVIPEQQFGIAPLKKLANAGDPAGFAEEPNAENNESTEGQRKDHRSATSDAVTIGCSGFAMKANTVNNEHSIQVEYIGIIHQQNLANNEEILEDSVGFAKEPNVVINEQHIPEESGIGPQQNLANAGEDILAGDPGGFAGEPNAVNNEQNILEEQAAGLMQQQNPANAQEDIQAEADPGAAMDEIFEFPLKNQLVDDLDGLLKDLDN